MLNKIFPFFSLKIIFSKLPFLTGSGSYSWGLLKSKWWADSSILIATTLFFTIVFRGEPPAQGSKSPLLYNILEYDFNS
jgi:hypothetical protein